MSRSVPYSIEEMRPLKKADFKNRYSCVSLCHGKIIDSGVRSFGFLSTFPTVARSGATYWLHLGLFLSPVNWEVIRVFPSVTFGFFTQSVIPGNQLPLLRSPSLAVKNKQINKSVSQPKMPPSPRMIRALLPTGGRINSAVEFSCPFPLPWELGTGSKILRNKQTTQSPSWGFNRTWMLGIFIDFSIWRLKLCASPTLTLQHSPNWGFGDIH